MIVENKKTTFVVFFIFLFLMCFSAEVKAQNKLPFTEGIKKIETKFDVKFSFDSRKANEFQISLPSLNQKLTKVLSEISSETEIVFAQIDERYITIQFPIIYISVCGTIIESAKGLPFDNADVLYGTQKIITTENGVFEIKKIPYDATISIVVNDYTATSISANSLQNQGINCPFVFINPNLNFLPTVTLENYVVKGISKNTNGSVTIKNSNFEILPSLIEPDILQIAQVLPGVASYDETASNINIRGGKSDETLILWNDMRMYQTGHFFGLISAFNPNLIKKMTVFKNGTHPAFGEGVSGVLSMESYTTVTQEFEGGVGVNLSSTNLFAKIPLSETFAFQVSGRTSINNGVGNPVYKEFFERTFQNTEVINLQSNTSFGLRSTDEDFSFYDISLAAIWDITKKDKLVYNFMTISNQLQFTERIIAIDSSEASNNKLRQRTLLGGITHTRNWSPNLKTTASYNSSTYVFNGNNTVDQLITLQSQRNEVKERAARAEISYRFSEKLTIDGGYQYINTNVANNDIIGVTGTATNNSTSANSFYSNASLTFNQKKTTLGGGIRYLNYGNFDNRIEPRITAHHKLNKVFTLFTAAELKSQTVFQFTARENQLLQLQTARWQVADGLENPLLTSKHISLGTAFSKNNWTLTVEGFYKNVEGINSANLGFRNQFQNAKAIGEYDVKGVEFSLGKKLKNFSTWLSYTYTDNQYNFPTLYPETFRSNLDVTQALGAAVTYGIKNLTFSLGVNYNSGLPFTPVNNQNVVIDNNGTPSISFLAPNSDTLNAYFRSDFSTKYEFKLDETFRGNLNLALLNIFNTENQLSRFYQISSDENGVNSINEVSTKSLGFTPNISFQLLF
jgi:hypothetical protein